MKTPKYEHTKEQLEQTDRCLAEVRERDIIGFDRWDKANLSGHSGTFCLKNGKEWHLSDMRHQTVMREKRTLQQYVDEGYNLKITGHHGDGQEAWWNNCCGNLDLVELMEIA